MKTTVSIVRLDSYAPEAVRPALEKLLDPLGGIRAFVPANGRTLLKPNFLRPSTADRAIATHPEVIRAVGRLARDAGAAEVIVSDSPGIGTATRCAERLGLGGESEPFEVMDADDGMDIDSGDATYHRLKISRRMLETDALINLAKVKTHGQMVLTAAAKNTFGAVVGLEKVQWHMRAGRDPMDFARLLLHIHERVSPVLNIVDGVVGMEGNGPGSGRPRKLGLLLASTNAHALDLVLCRILGIRSGDVYTLRLAEILGLLPPDDQIVTVGEGLDAVRLDGRWKLARPVLPTAMGPGWMTPVLERLLALEPAIDHKACTACGECVTACAAGAMSMSRADDKNAARVVIAKKTCISCFCCQEMCPSGAISVKAGLAARLLGLGMR